MIAWRHLLKSQKDWNYKVLLDIIAIPSLCYTIEPVSVEIWWSYW